MKKPAGFKFKLKGEKVQTPKAVGQYLWINKPNTRFAEEGEAGNYEATILLSKEQAAPIIEQIDRIHKAAAEEVKETGKKPKLADAPYSEDDKTGMIKFKFKKPAVSKIDGKEVKNHVAVVDAKVNPIPQGKVPAMGSGSVIRINGFISPFYVPALGVGVSLKLRGIQLIKLVEMGGNDIEFTAEEDDDGYSFSKDSGEAEAAPEKADDAGDTDEAVSETPDF